MMLELFGSLQISERTGPLKNLSSRLAEQAKPIFKTLRNRQSREALAARLSGLAEGGDLARITREVAFTRVKAEDNQAYALAQARFAELTRLRLKLEAGITGSDPDAQRFGAAGASFVGFIVLSVTALAVFAGG